TANAYQRKFAFGFGDAFVTKFAPAGNSLVYSTYLGGTGRDSGSGIAVDASGAAYVTGTTDSTNFPTTHTRHRGLAVCGYDPAVAPTPPSISLVYSTYLGGSGVDWAKGIAVAASGSAYLTGFTYSTHFPPANPFQGENAGFGDAFVTKFAPAGNSLVYSTYLG